MKKDCLIFLWQGRMQSLWSTAYFSCWPTVIQKIMRESYFYFAFSTAVVKSTVEPAGGHSSAGLPLLRVPSSAQQWLLCSWLASSQTQIDLPGRWPWTSLNRRLGPPTSSCSQLSNSQTLLSLQCPALGTSSE